MIQNKNPNNNLGNLIIHVVTIAILFIIGGWGMFYYLRSGETSLLSVETSPQLIRIIRPPESTLLKNESLEAEFKGALPHLGIVSVRFDTYNRINQDKLRFSIRIKNNSNWHYEGLYKTDQFQPEGLFPFGFPEIINSEGETFQINLTSESGTPSSAVAISNNLPVLTTRYVLNLKALKQEPSLFFRFLWYKSANIISDTRLVVNLIISFLPFILYLLIHNKIRNKLVLFTLSLFATLINLPRFASGPVVEFVSALAVIGLLIITTIFTLKIIRYNSKNE